MSNYNEEDFGEYMVSNKKTPKYKEILTIEDVEKFEIADGIPERNITKKTCEHFQIRAELDGYSMQVAHYFPVTYKHKVVGYIRRDLNLPKKKAWSSIGTVTDDCELLGTVQAEKTAKKTLLIVEGVYDYPAAWQMLMKHTPEQYRGAIDVVSLTMGTANAVKNLMYNKKFLDEHLKVVLCFDSDSMKDPDVDPSDKGMRGKDATIAVGLKYKSALTINLGKNDPCEYLIDGEGKEFYNMVRWEQSEIEFAHITKGVGVTKEELLEVPPQGFLVPEFPILMEKLGGFRPHEFTSVLGAPKFGKTLFTQSIVYSLRKNYDVPVCYASLEDTRKQITEAFVSLHASKKVKEFRRNRDIIPNEVIDDAYKTILNPDKFLLIDTEQDTIRPMEIIALLEKAVDMGAKFLVLDHFSFLLSGSDNANERKELDQLATAAKNITKKYPVHLLGVSHVNVDTTRGAVRNDMGMINYPYTYRTQRYDARGSRILIQVSDNLLMIDGRFIGDEVVGERQIKIGANRRWEETGLCDWFEMSQETGRLNSILEPEYN